MPRASFLLLALLAAPAVQGQPRVSVKARAHLDDLQAVVRGRDVVVSGALRDNLGQPVPEAPVVVEGEALVPGNARTGPDGRFSVRLDFGRDGRRSLVVRYPGGPLLDGAVARTEIYVGRRLVRLRVDLPEEVDADRPIEVSLAATTQQGEPEPGLWLRLSLDGEAIERVRTEENGAARAWLPPLPPGRHQLAVYTSGDDLRMQASVERAFEVTRPLTLSLALATPTPLVPGHPLVLEGRVEGGPTAGVQILLTANGRPLDDGEADGRGRFAFTVAPGELKPGPVVFRANAHTEAPGFRDGVSGEVQVEVPPPPPPSAWWVWAPGILAGISLLGAVGRRGLLRLRRAPRPPRPQLADEPLPTFTFETAARGGPADLSVLVRDAVTGRPLPALVVLLAPDAPEPAPGSTRPPAGTATQADDEGRARLTGAGDRLWAWTPGYAPVCHALPAASGRAVIPLLPLRARLQTLYAEVLTEAGRPPLRFGWQTPREAERPLSHRGAPSDPLARLTALVERACFGPSAPRPEDLIEAFALAADVRRGLSDRGAA